MADASRAGPPYLSIEGVSKSFGSFQALRDITLAIAEREFVCFLGPSGCGKTTLLRAIAGLDIQTTGRIVQAGRDVSALPPSARDVGIVFQSYALFPNLTVADNVGYGLVSRGMPREARRARVDELLALVGLTEHRAKYPAQISGGQQQRVALARALATSPGLLLLDEPLSALDAKVRQYLRGELRALQRKLGVTTVMVTHDQEEALTMADRIVVMNMGHIEQVGTPAEIYGQPATPFVADFIGAMNFMTGSVAGPGRVRVGSIELAAPALNGAATGTTVTVCCRPEDVVPADGAQDNAFDARVATLEFLGPNLRATLEPPGAERVTAEFSATLARRLGLTAGGTLRVAMPGDRLRIFGSR
ncbi:MAG: putative 2-aminoethylphosphonate ABC transporter ATP-binding protein [Alphaproteobacteria bacterium]|nr:putative 2-aminoethylphosphonate ABC transporter ATP-binding protein [Alphaproteobacteria bacterium]